MQIVLNDGGYIDGFAVVGGVEGGLEIPEPQDMADFAENFKAYKIENGALIKDEAKAEAIAEAAVLDNLRLRRETECFPVINRGELWYSRLTDIQKQELDAWYTAWLDVTETKVIPDSPEWINSAL